MDNDHSTVSDLETSTEGIFGFEFRTTNVWGITSTNHGEVFESDGIVIDGMYVLYGMGGILIFFIIYTICYSYCMHLKESSERRATELSRLNERLSRIAFHYPPASEGRVFIENINEVHPNNQERTKPKTFFGVPRTTENTQVVENNFIFEPRPSTRLPDESRYNLDPSCSNTSLTLGFETSRSASQSEDDNTEVKEIDWMSEPPLAFSSPQESKDNLFLKQDSVNLIDDNTAHLEECVGAKSLEKDTDITPSKIDGRRSPSPERRSRSSPSSPDIVRRRMQSSECATPRPTSWQ